VCYIRNGGSVGQYGGLKHGAYIWGTYIFGVLRYSQPAWKVFHACRNSPLQIKLAKQNKMQVIYKQDARKSVNSLGLVIRLLDGTTIIWPIEELIVTCPLFNIAVSVPSLAPLP
jgi:hypothetical protein